MNSDFSDQLPEPEQILQSRLNPRADELKMYQEMFFDPALDGYQNELEFLTGLPFRRSTEVKSSPLGVGFELLDHRCGYDFDKVVPLMRDSGVKWARLQSGWQRAEQEEGRYDFAWLDHIVDSLLEAGIQPWFSLGFGNGIYMDAEPVPPHGSYFFSPTVFGERACRGWTRYCRAMARHFSSRVSHWEVWNEPNAGFLRKPGMKKTQAEEPSEYVKLVQLTAAAVRSVQPAAKIIGGAISGCDICNEYIGKLFRAGIADWIDIFSYHPYNGVPELYWPERLQFIRDQIARSGKEIPVWQGENGRPSNSALLRRGWKSTEGSQARYLARRYLSDLRLDIGMTSYFLACDIGNGYLPNGGIHAQGVIDASDPDHYRPKLAFRTMQSFAWLFDSDVRHINVNFEIHPCFLPLSYTTSPLENFSGISCGFRIGGIPLFAYYHVTSIDADWAARPVSIHTWIPDNLSLKHPVLIDPITAKIYRIRRQCVYSDGNYGSVLLFPRVPLLDYPLFITDASILERNQSGT